MAGTYGEPGKNVFQVKGVGGILSPVVNAETGVTQIYRQDSALNVLIGKPQFTSLGTYNPTTKKFTADTDASLGQDQIKSLSSPEATTAITNAATTATKKAVIAAGGTQQEADAKAKNLTTPNAAKTDESADVEAANKELSGAGIEGTRYGFNGKSGTDPLVFPATLRWQKQDAIKFSMVMYSPRKVDAGSETSNINPVQDRRKVGTKDIIGTVVLPIPTGLSDSNSVNWGSDQLDPVQGMLVSLANAGITGGLGPMAQTAGNIAETGSEQSEDAKTMLASKFIEAATGTQNILSRTRGAIINPNMELLFQGPSLRPFNFTFKLSARSQDEAIRIKKIIRFFKQGMAPIRSSNNNFLKAPHTFQIEYLHLGKTHQFLNAFKECALQSFSVDYTPEGQYATYTDGAMVSYQITMQFQELEPIFNDDYAKFNNDGNTDQFIGY